MTKFGRIWLASVLVLILFFGCTTASHHMETDQSTPPPVLTRPSLTTVPDVIQLTKGSSVDIEYVLGRDHYHLSMVSNKNQIDGKMTLDQQLLGKNTIDPQKYAKYFERVLTFIDDQSKSQPFEKLEDCKAPFKVTIKSETGIKTTQGCRSSNHGKLSRIIKEGEFLLYSKN